MLLRCDVPDSLESYIGNLDEAAVSKIVTIMLELAIKNGLLDYPISHVERNLLSIKTSIEEMRKEQNIFLESIKKLVDDSLSSRIVNTISYSELENTAVDLKEIGSVSIELNEDDILNELLKESIL